MSQAHTQQKHHLAGHAACRIAGSRSPRQLDLSLFFPVTCSHGLSRATTGIHRTGQ